MFHCSSPLQDSAQTPRLARSEAVDNPSSASSSRLRRPRSEVAGSASRIRAVRRPLEAVSRRSERRRRRRAADSVPRRLGALGSPAAARRLVALHLVPSQPLRRSVALDSRVHPRRPHLARHQRLVGLGRRLRQDSGSSPRQARRLADRLEDSAPPQPLRHSAVQVAALVNRRHSLPLGRPPQPRLGLAVEVGLLAVGRPVALSGSRLVACRRHEAREVPRGERRKRLIRVVLGQEPPCTLIQSRACPST